MLKEGYFHHAYMLKEVYFDPTSHSMPTDSLLRFFKYQIRVKERPEKLDDKAVKVLHDAS